MSNSAERIVLILVGLIGSGKSTFAAALEHHFSDQWRRCNQDELGSRTQVEFLARNSLRAGLSVCIDRTNFDEKQRAHWVKIANEFPGTFIWVIVFSTPYEVCASRLKNRTSHPTIHSPEQGLQILSRFASDYRPPTTDEGFHRIISLHPSDTSLNYSSADVLSILERVRSSPVISRPAQPVRVSWAERRRQTRPDGRGRRQHDTSPYSGSSDRPSLLNRVWEQGTSAIFSARSSVDSSSGNPALESRPTHGTHASDSQDEQKFLPPLKESRDLHDSLGVD
ncbi:hypothetical protein GYMLUDRAFT_42564 [Collybiopsis luxurians FD-317 M1]|uniref:P-loop containing nucleoside triphosphate hydrolase protein n=1 Tax=Collybiopsis luxurians FD-317 M1 TaxID=944289 RepID=A0A0D0CG48_9AGAR|nr:hypothetical protein GYMLUDRAFT_42564 [Collybiopsis luxurians FD-317 M1]